MKKLNRVYKKEHLDSLTTDEMFSGQRFTILAMFSGKLAGASFTAFLEERGSTEKQEG